MPVEWPKSLNDLSRQEEILRGSDHINGHQQQQDSEIVAVSEYYFFFIIIIILAIVTVQGNLSFVLFLSFKAEMCESTSLGDLCHQKPLLRLPLTTVNVSTMEDEGQETEQEEEKNNEVNVETKVENDNFILPTPSCTGSMDSLSSSSGSDRPMSFTTFGKTTQSESFEDSLTSSRDGSGDGSNPTEGDVGIDREDLINEVERRNQKVSHERSTRISDSTDEDSGIESVSRIIK